MDAGTNRQLLWIDRFMPLPVGTRIELMEPRSNAEVTGTRLWGADSGKSTLAELCGQGGPASAHCSDGGRSTRRPRASVGWLCRGHL
jgi:hypothetical protein